MSEIATVQSESKNRNVINIVERIGSVFSLLGCGFIITTFCFSKAFHKPINRLVFYASLGNGVVSIASLMATSFVDTPGSAGCQVQGFLIQMLMPADALWTLAMAINVYLTFYHKYDGAALRKMELVYLLCCYGIPFVPALVYLFIKDGHGNRMYGNAGLWCWISKHWGLWRIFTFYGPVWVVILSTLFIYIRTGGDIYRNRKNLQSFSRGEIEATITSPTWVKKEVHITSEAVCGSGSKHTCLRGHRESTSSSHSHQTPKTAYSVSITATKASDQDHPIDNFVSVPIHSNRGSSSSQAASTLPGSTRQAMSRAEWSYAKCAMLFFTAMFITWIPSSANRVYSVVHHNQSSTALEYMSAVVLPLQGFWNAVIYIVTSWKACKMFFNDVRNFRRTEPTEMTKSRSVARFKHAIRLQPIPLNQESESTTRLATSSISRVGSE